MRWVAGRGVASARSLLRRPVPPVWVVAVVAAAAGLLISAVVIQAARLVEESWQLAQLEEANARRTARPVTGQLTTTGGGTTVDLTGPPGGSVMILAAGLEPVVVELDARGRGTAPDLLLPAGTETLRLLPVDVEEATSVAVPSATPTATPTATPSPTATAAPSPSHSPTPPAPAARTRTAVRPPTQPPPAATVHSEARRPSPPSAARIREIRAAGRNAPPVLQLVGDAGGRLALTFDGGDAANGTGDLLDLLDRLHLRVTLFVTGEFIDQHPALVRRAVLAGHEIGNHTYSHPHLTTYATNHRHDLLDHVNRRWLQEELRRTEEAFHRATGRTMAPIWRAPYGEENAALRGWAMELGYLHVRWSSLGGASLDALDWVNDEHSAIYRDSERIITRLLAFPRLEGGIVLMHLSSDRKRPAWRELPSFLDSLHERGLEVGTVGELLQASPTWRTWLERAAKRHRKVFGAPRP